MAIFVFVHESVDGGWAWQGVGKILQQAGHNDSRFVDRLDLVKTAEHRSIFT